MHSIHVILVDDEPRIRVAWQGLIRQQPDMELRSVLASADEFMANLPDELSVALVDLSMPGRDPLGAVSELRDAQSPCRVLIYSGHSDSNTTQAVLAAGAWGLVDKLMPPMEVLDVVRGVARGEPYFPNVA